MPRIGPFSIDILLLESGVCYWERQTSVPTRFSRSWLLAEGLVRGKQSITMFEITGLRDSIVQAKMDWEVRLWFEPFALRQFNKIIDTQGFSHGRWLECGD